MTDDLETLSRKIQQAEKDDTPSTDIDAVETSRGIAAVSRLAVEMLAGVVVGLGAGYLLDRWLGTSPWLLLLCFFLGCAAGFVNLIRAAKELDKPSGSGKNGAV